MDAGAEVSWPERYNPDELSAIQHAMNLRLRDEAAFQAEYQNDPLPAIKDEDDLLAAEQIAAKSNGHKRGIVPVGVTRLTAFIDVSSGCCTTSSAAGRRFHWLRHRLNYRSAHSILLAARAKLTLTNAAPGTGLEGSFASLESLCEPAPPAVAYRRQDGPPHRALLIGANRIFG